jgi:hypothetical protein
MFHHSMEHMSDNVAVLRCAHDKLAPHGKCVVRIPVASWAWQHYRHNWVQLDAPRHLVIHTPDSFRRAAEQAGFRISRVTFDSGTLQFCGSELYKRDIPLKQKNSKALNFSKSKMREFMRASVDLNRRNLGDQAAFYLESSSPAT